MIIKAGIEYARALSEIGTETFIDAHQDSAPVHEIQTYVKEKYSIAAIKKELSDPANIYHIIMHGDKIAGFSKMALNGKHPAITTGKITKLDQIYLLKSFYGLKLGAQLLQYNIDYSKSHNQSGMWLVVWTGNDRAVNFYERYGFQVISEDGFHLTETHTNPCYTMLLDYAANENTGD
ncbi:MAG TPA: GNAT family N-acetyltransferase [Chitinophaga sp.]|uniref:GNAT family N-acetyltransferase n=1 Tax=Chitinophaga sp. TaxID=1869181 RepID=UPI002BCFBE69|nr:GNAT family N-acetyltransferase [Chitinophaga sp.]HVI43446.1 GNAT family N-acetyltransferase [Chitinophaga sp.]